MRSSFVLGLFALSLANQSARAAEPVPSLELRHFTPPAAPHAALLSEPTQTPGPGAWNVGVFAGYAHRSVVILDQSGTEVLVPLEHQLTLDYLASVGVGDRFALALSLPTVLYQSGDEAGLIGASELPKSALGDAAFDAKLALVQGPSLGGFGLAALARVTAPVGNPRSYLADGAATGAFHVLMDVRAIALELRARAGVHVRSAPRDFVAERFGHDLPWAVGLVLRPQALGLDPRGRFRWHAEIGGAVALTPSFASAPQSPIAYSFSARYTVGEVSALAGVELPITDAVGLPSVRGVLGIGWAPRFYDQDGDGVEDDDDQCPELPEDPDGFEDADGCPDFDNDDDGVPDEFDRCPGEQEDEDGFEDDDGCPDPDNDGDGIADERDACPDRAGVASRTPELNGCPPLDLDHDGLVGERDRCPTDAEDHDGFEDADGCPDPDNDGDAILDEEDACPLVPGPERSDPNLNGCPNPDQDGDTFDDAHDQCPAEPENFDGREDEDGCPESAGARPALASIERQGGTPVLKITGPLGFGTGANAAAVSAESVPTLRAIAQLLNSRPNAVVLVGVRATRTTADGEQEALNRAFSIALALRRFTYRDEVAEIVGYQAVRAQTVAATGIGLMLLDPEARGAP